RAQRAQGQPSVGDGGRLQYHFRSQNGPKSSASPVFLTSNSVKSRGRRTALLLVDFINPFDFTGRRLMLGRALRAARRTAALKARLRKAGIRCIYVNDNFGDWTSEFHLQVESLAARSGGEGEIARLLRPGKGDLSVLKPRHSGFYGTPLEFLLDELGVGKLV